MCIINGEVPQGSVACNEDTNIIPYGRFKLHLLALTQELKERKRSIIKSTRAHAVHSLDGRRTVLHSNYSVLITLI